MRSGHPKDSNAPRCATPFCHDAAVAIRLADGLPICADCLKLMRRGGGMVETVRSGDHVFLR